MLGLKIFVRVQKFSAEALRAFAQLLPPWSLYAQIIANMSHYSAHYNRHPYSEKDSFGGNVHHTRNQKATIKAFDKFYSWFPSFLDMFPDEETFLNFALWFVVLTIIGVFIAARFITIKPHQV